MNTKKLITSALISVFNKDGLDEIVKKLEELQVKIYSTGGTQHYIESLGVEVNKVEDITGYPSILDGRVKTLHPGVFGGILAIRNEDHLNQLAKYNIPTFDLVIVDLYPFEETLANTNEEEAIIEKIDIGGISLIRAAAKNHGDVVIIPSKNQYGDLYDILENHRGKTDLDVRKRLAMKAFEVSSHYDTAIHQYFAIQSNVDDGFKYSMMGGKVLRYGENPHQKSTYYGDFEDMFEIHGGKELSFNNLVDVDAAVQLMHEFRDEKPTFAILKHTNACGVATRNNSLEAWKFALAGDPVSAFGGILIANCNIDKETAQEIDEIFYEVLIAPSFDSDALALLLIKKKRIVLIQKKFDLQRTTFKTLLNGVIKQDADFKTETIEELKVVTKVSPSEQEIKDLIFANKLVKHLKSNTIVLVKNHQMLGMGCGQTSRVEACKQAIEKATQFGFNLRGAVMASDAFFPFPDCVELGYNAGLTAVIQPGGSIKDQLSIDYCDEQSIAMVFTGVRHFKH